MCWLFLALLLDPTADGHNTGTRNLVSWVLHCAPGLKKSQRGASQTEIVLVLIFFLIGLWKHRVCTSEVCAYGLHITYEREKRIHAFFHFCFLLNKEILKLLFFVGFFFFFPLNFTFLSSLHFDSDFQKWSVILTNFISGSPKSRSHWCSQCAEPTYYGGRATGNCQLHLHILHIVAFNFSCSCHRTQWKTRKLECEISWCGVVL